MSDNPSQVMEATTGFVTEIDGDRITVNRNTTRVAASHELVKRFPQYFRPVEDGLSFAVEEATAEPGVRRTRVQHNAERPKAAESPAAKTAESKPSTTEHKPSKGV